MSKYKDQVIFVTGAGSGIGKEVAHQFAAQGAQIALSDINLTTLEQTKEEIIAKHGVEVRAYQLNVAVYDQVKDVVHAVHADFGRLDHAINNAGIGASAALSTAEHTLEDWDRVVAVNQSGVFYCMKEELRIMKAQGSGSVVNVSSIAGMRALPKQIAYVASKHAVIGMTKTAALEYARYGIRVNAVCPVFTNSPLLDKLFSSKEGLRENLIHSIPLGRYGEVKDIANGVLWLCDPDSSFVTGLCLPLDGGQTA